VVNTLRLLGRWMRIFTIPIQSSVRNDVPIPYDTFFPESVLVDRLVNEINWLISLRDASEM